MDQFESDLLSIVHSLIPDLSETDVTDHLHHVKAGACNASCIRQLLVKLLRSSGYDAAVCISKWQGIGKVPGGMTLHYTLKYIILFFSFILIIYFISAKRT